MNEQATTEDSSIDGGASAVDRRVGQHPSHDAAYAMGAKGGPVVEAERTAFESWVHGHCWNLGAEWDGKSYVGVGERPGSSYVCPLAMRTRMMWAAWRDRAALMPN